METKLKVVMCANLRNFRKNEYFFEDAIVEVPEMESVCNNKAPRWLK